MERVSVFIDGFNLYHGLRDAGYQRYYWLNIVELSKSFLELGQELEHVFYFTALLKGGTASRDRARRDQTALIEAYETLPDCSLTFGRCLVKGGVPPNERTEEKGTDVNIAIEILAGALLNQYDRAIVISGNSDLAPAIRKAIVLTGKSLIVAFPPKRFSKKLIQGAHNHFAISKTKLRHCQLPDQITKQDGTVITRPNTWRSREVLHNSSVDHSGDTASQ